MKIWKRNAIVATVLVLVCAGVYLNWNSAQADVIDLTQTLNEDQIMGGTDLAVVQTQEESVTVSSQDQSTEDYFAQIRLSRQETRDSAVELLQETIAYEEDGADAAAAVASLDSLVDDALAESQIESLVIAKGYHDCVAYMNDDIINVAVSAGENGLVDNDIALISDIVTTQTDYTLGDIRIIEVK